MKKVLFFLVLSTSLMAQNIKVNFKFHVNTIYDYTSTSKNFTLTQNSSNSLFKFDDINNSDQIKYKEQARLMKTTDTLTTFLINGETLLTFYRQQTFKNFVKNIQITNYKLELKLPQEYVEDKINMFSWEILSKKDTIIGGFNCKTATTNFRGREYLAYFTSEIANQGGPWKFDGLPGFILRVESVDGYLLIEPPEISISKESSKEIINPFENKKVVFFIDLHKILVEKDKRYVSRSKSLPNPPDRITMSVPDMIENTGLGERIYE